VGNRLGDISAFDARDLKLLETLAQHLGVSLESARLGILQADVAQLNEINQMKDDLIASTSHELRTPLTSIQGFVKTLLRPDVHLSMDEQRSFHETVARQSDRLTHMVEDLLTASRLESERVDLTLSSVSVSGLVLRVIDEVRPRPGDHRFDLRLEGDPDVLSDAERIQQILLSLVVNAIKYSPKATTITWRRAHTTGACSCPSTTKAGASPLRPRGRSSTASTRRSVGDEIRRRGGPGPLHLPEAVRDAGRAPVAGAVGPGRLGLRVVAPVLAPRRAEWEAAPSGRDRLNGGARSSVVAPAAQGGDYAGAAMASRACRPRRSPEARPERRRRRGSLVSGARTARPS
jgi:hypothetical protein